MSWYKPNLFVGNHDFKMGFDYAAAHADRKISSRDGSKQRADRAPDAARRQLRARLQQRRPVPDGRLEQLLQGRPAGVRAEGSHAHDLALRAGQLDDRAPAHAEPRRSATPTRSGSSRNSAARRPMRRCRPCTRPSAGPAHDFPTWNSLVPRLARRLRHRRGRQDRPQGRLRTVRAQLALRRAADGQRERPPADALPLARQQRQQAVRAAARSTSTATGRTSSPRACSPAARTASPARCPTRTSRSR